MSYFLAPKQPSTEKNGNQCAWQPVSIHSTSEENWLLLLQVEVNVGADKY
jgi:hypothetical protein